ncbi:putative citrate synthase 2 [delta proteobacterium NaphS2]|nr:putative citrate synthase 2 [delta proteobacterium NaphS2]
MPETVHVKNMGLRGVTVADTKISFIDGEKGILLYRGYRIEQLAESSTFMEVAYLILNGALPDRASLLEFEKAVKEARTLPGYVIENLKNLPRDAAPMDVLQSSIPALGISDPDLGEDTKSANVAMSIRLLARMPVLVAAWHRISQGLEPLPSDDTLSHAANFLWQFHGEKPDAEMARDLDTCLVLHADHTFNASTFACREVVSTRAHMYAGVCAGIGALSGSLHGGANARVMKMLLALEFEKDIPGWVKKELDGGGRIMGMGHAVYKTMDPRAKFLKSMAARLGQKAGQTRWHELSTQIEEFGIKAFRDRGKTNILPNVDFYSAPVYHIMGIPFAFMTPIFAISRVSGWCAHIIEEKFAEAQEKPALYRPKAEYVGDYCGLIGCEYEPIENRQG